MVFVADPDVPDLAALGAVLAANGIDSTPADRDGQLVMVEPERFYGGGYIQLIDQASDGGRRQVRTFGGPRLAATVLTVEQFLGFEDQLATSWQRHGTTSLCRYHEQDLVGTGGLAEATARHESGWGDPLLHAHRPRPNLLVLAGEADISNTHVMGAIIAEALRSTGSHLVIDCAALEFASIGAWRAVADAVEHHAGVQVRLTGMSASAQRMLALLKPAGLAIDDL
jgi:anti-anti-sigma regulatory factor